jgi:hypothetical protein
MATKYKATPKATSPFMPNTNPARRGINLRPVASSAAGTADIGDLYVGQEAIGVLVGADPARQWLDIETIDGVAVTTKTFTAAWLCDVTEIVVVEPPVPNQPNIRVDVTLFDDWTGRVDVILNEETPPIATWTGRLKPPPLG